MSNRRYIYVRHIRDERKEEGWKDIAFRKACPTSKNIHISPNRANKALRSLVRSGDAHKVESLAPYICPECGYYHLGHRSNDYKQAVHESLVVQMKYISYLEA